MSSQSKHSIAISYAKHALEPGSREYERMQTYAALLTSYHVIVFTRASEGFPLEQHIGSLHLYATNARTKIGMLWRSYQIGRSIIKNNPAEQFVVSSQDPFETSLIGRALARAKNVSHHVQIHGDVFNPASYQSSVLQRIRVVYGRYVVRRAVAIRVVSDRIKQSLLTTGVAERLVTVLPVQADLTALLPVGVNRTYTPQSPLRLLFLGRLAPEKQLPILLDACAILQTNNVDFQLQIVGSGPEESRLKQQVADKQLDSQVTFTPWSNDIVLVMQQSDVFCLPSKHEGWGMVLLEAAAAGLAIVTTDVGCVGEAIKHQESALVVENATQFAAAVTRLTDVDLRATLASSAHQVAEQFVVANTDYTQQWVAGQFPLV